MTKQQYLTEPRSRFVDGKIGRNRDYENSSEKNVDAVTLKDSLVVDSTATTRPVVKVTVVLMGGMGNMVSHLDIHIIEALYEASMRVMRAVYSVEMRIFGVLRSVV